MIRLKRAVETGDTVEFQWLEGLVQRSGIGRVSMAASSGVRVKVTRWTSPPNGAAPDYVEVWRRDVVVVVDEAEIVKWMYEQFKLIASQDQALGGQATPQQAWEGAKRIAEGVINRFPNGEFK